VLPLTASPWPLPSPTLALLPWLVWLSSSKRFHFEVKSRSRLEMDVGIIGQSNQ
jgi:hypothetical protein